MLDARLTVIGKYVGFDREDITVDNTEGGVSLTLTKLETTPRPKRVFITVESAQCRYCYDSTVPTSTLGHILNPNDNLFIEGYHNMKNFRAIRTGTTSGKICVTYER